MLKICLVVFLISLIKTISTDDYSEWNEFKLKYEKQYLSYEEEKVRQNNYFKNKAYVLDHNNKYYQIDSQNLSWKASLNEFSDMSWEEFNSVMNGLKPELKKPNNEIFGATEDFEAPEELDYRKLGYVTDVKNQGSCGSCWAFSATGSLEGQIFKTKNTLVSLSEQNLVDCSTSYGNQGCGGGLMDNAYEYIKDNNGIDTEESYPYEAVDGECRYNKKTKGAEDSGFVDIKAESDKALMQALVEKGPIAVAIYADQKFMSYSSGIFESKGCMGMGLNHGVLLIGYGTDSETGKKYWLVKNSWGTSWGEEGYIKMSREIKDNCGISTMASYPKV